MGLLFPAKSASARLYPLVFPLTGSNSWTPALHAEDFGSILTISRKTARGCWSRYFVVRRPLPIKALPPPETLLKGSGENSRYDPQRRQKRTRSSSATGDFTSHAGGENNCDVTPGTRRRRGHAFFQLLLDYFRSHLLHPPPRPFRFNLYDTARGLAPYFYEQNRCYFRHLYDPHRKTLGSFLGFCFYGSIRTALVHFLLLRTPLIPPSFLRRQSSSCESSFLISALPHLYASSLPAPKLQSAAGSAVPLSGADKKRPSLKTSVLSLSCSSMISS